MTDSQDQNPDPGEIDLSLREHNIGFILPVGARLEGKLLIPHGVLIYGDFIGDIFCESGSAIVMAGGRFRGMLEADRVYIEGDVSSVTERRSTLIARQMIAGSATSRISADIFSKSFALHKAKVWGTLRTLEEAQPLRKNNRATATEGARLPGKSIVPAKQPTGSF